MKIKLTKKTIIVLSGLGLLSLFLIIALRLPTKETTKDVPVSIPPVFSTIPTNNELDVTRNLKSVDIFFKNDLAEKDKSSINVVLSGDISYSAIWLTNKQLTLKLGKPLFYDTLYKFDIVHKDIILESVSFRTEIEPISEVDYIWLEENAKLVGEAEVEAARDKPWLYSLPLVTDDYFVSYLTTSNKFRISLYIPETASSQEKEVVINEALNALKKRDVDMSLYDYYVVYK